MPLYDLKCINCGRVSEVLLDHKDLDHEDENGQLDLFGKIFCPTCKKTVFVRLPSAHGKTPVNWASWKSSSPKK